MMCVCTTPDELALDFARHIEYRGNAEGIVLTIDPNPKPYRNHPYIKKADPLFTLEDSIMNRSWQCHGMNENLKSVCMLVQKACRKFQTSAV